MPTLLIHDALRAKKVRLNLKDETTVQRTLEVLQGRYPHLEGKRLLLSVGGSPLAEDWTLGHVVSRFGIDETTVLELDERAGPLDGASAEFDMADLDTIEAVTALEQQLERLEANAVDIDGFDEFDEFPEPGHDAPAAAAGAPSARFSLEDDVSSAAENRSDSGDGPVIALPPDPLETHDLLGQDELDSGSDEELPTVAFAAPPAPVASGPAIERRVTVRYHERMIVGRNFPLVVILSKKDAKEAERDRATAGPVAIAPLLPGCLVVPAERVIDASSARVEASFWVTPLSGEGLAESRLEIRQGTEIREIVPIPSSASRREPVRWLATMGSVLLVGSGLLALWAGHLSAFARSLGGDVLSGAVLGGVLVVLAAALRLVRRPRESEPRTASVSVGPGG